MILAGILMPAEFTSHMAILVNRERSILWSRPNPRLKWSPEHPGLRRGNQFRGGAAEEPRRAEQVVLANGLEKQHGIFLDLFRPKQDEADRVERAVRTLAKKIKVETATKTNMIEVTYSSSDPALSYGVLNTLGNLYMEKHVAVHRPPGSYQFFAQETQHYQPGAGGFRSSFASFGQNSRGSGPGPRAHGSGSALPTPSASCTQPSRRLPPISSVSAATRSR